MQLQLVLVEVEVIQELIVALLMVLMVVILYFQL